MLTPPSKVYQRTLLVFNDLEIVKHWFQVKTQVYSAVDGNLSYPNHFISPNMLFTRLNCFHPIITCTLGTMVRKQFNLQMVLKFHLAMIHVWEIQALFRGYLSNYSKLILKIFGGLGFRLDQNQVFDVIFCDSSEINWISYVLVLRPEMSSLIETIGNLYLFEFFLFYREI